jgi:uncharacterized protein
MAWLTLTQWSPYVVGVGLGLLGCLTFLLSDKPLGCSTAFARNSGLIETLFRGPKVLEKEYHRKFVPEVDWEWVLVLGVVIGAFFSAQLSGQFQNQWVPAKWSETFGASPFPRWIVALLGGIIMGFGARWAGGCTSGHGLSGTHQLAVSSWLALFAFFAGGIPVALLLFKVLGG